LDRVRAPTATFLTPTTPTAPTAPAEKRGIDLDRAPGLAVEDAEVPGLPGALGEDGDVADLAGLQDAGLVPDGRHRADPLDGLALEVLLGLIRPAEDWGLEHHRRGELAGSGRPLELPGLEGRRREVSVPGEVTGEGERRVVGW